eukprot:TRINITY_DN55_c0_g1_i2.p1 TRINITY_DN55_c0_g1~~TRINITY_DN55_c0_g1_i2.p1  ORF type:complete len:471 (-),score=118.73 TRINITY_DN55_c0_g1_i2:79-1335(-)
MATSLFAASKAFTALEVYTTYRTITASGGDPHQTLHENLKATGTAADVQQHQWAEQAKQTPDLAALQIALAPRVYLVGNAQTAADVAMVAAVATLVSALDERAQLEVPAVVRWFDLLQHTGSAPTTSLVEFDLSLPFKPPKPVKEGEQGKPAGGKQAKAAKPAQQKKEASAATEKKEAPAATEKKEAPAATEKKEAPAATEKKEAPAADAETKETPQPKAKGKAAAAPRAKAAKAPPAKKEEKEDIVRLDIRVGKIIEVGPHPAADTLYVEKIDLGEPEPRVVVSGLRNFVPENEMLGASVICLCNLKPAKMRTVMSHAMVLCGSNDDHTKVELIVPPAAARPGDRVTFPGFDGEPDERLPAKRDVFGLLKPDLFVSEQLVATYRDKKTGQVVPFTVAGGNCTVRSLANSHVGAKAPS